MNEGVVGRWEWIVGRCLYAFFLLSEFQRGWTVAGTPVPRISGFLHQLNALNGSHGRIRRNGTTLNRCPSA